MPDFYIYTKQKETTLRVLKYISFFLYTILSFLLTYISNPVSLESYIHYPTISSLLHRIVKQFAIVLYFLQSHLFIYIINVSNHGMGYVIIGISANHSQRTLTSFDCLLKIWMEVNYSFFFEKPRHFKEVPFLEHDFNVFIDCFCKWNIL